MTRALTAREREILAAVHASSSRIEAAKRLGITPGGLRGALSYISSKTGGDVDSSETPAEAKARVAREVASGLRCKCMLLLPCADHQP